MDKNLFIQIQDFINLIIILFHSISMEEQPSAKQPLDCAYTDQVREQLNDLFQEISIHPNVFLQRQLRNFMIQLLQNTTPKAQSCFPDWFLERKNNLQSKLSKLSDPVMSEVMNQFCQKFESMELSQPSPNQAANILLDTTLAKKLPLKLSQKFIKLIETTKDDEKILAFIKQRFEEGVNQRQFLNQIKAKKIKGRNVPDLNTLIAQTIILRPKEKVIIDKLLSHKDNCRYFEGQIIEITSSDGSQSANGKIIKASYNLNVYTFEVIRFQDKLLVQIYLANESIQKIVVNQTKLQPLRSTFDILIIMKTKVNDSIISIVHNANNFSNSVVLPEGEYKIELDKIHWNFIFTALNNKKKYRFKFYQRNNDFEKIKYLENRQYYTPDEFFSCYFVQVRNKKSFTFQNNQDILRCVKIYKAYIEDGRQFIEKLQRIQRKKENLIGKLYQLPEQQYQLTFGFLVDPSRINKQWLERFGLYHEVQNILRLARQLGDQISIQALICDILNKVNYTKLVSKSQTLNTIKAIELFTSSQSLTSTIKDKDIISFYGNTGSGKSTSVNFLTGVRLQKANNRFGDIIVRQATQESQERQIIGQNAKIGQSNGLSQTLFTKGYKIRRIGQMQDQSYENVVLCDNPGFQDTRGTQYEICTNLSMDRSYQVCKSIRAIVLIVPYQAIMLDKGTPLLKLMFEMEHRFPDILNRQSYTFKRFYLLITKNSNRQQNNETIASRFSETYSEFVRHHGQNNSLNNLQQYEINSKLKVYQILKLMSDRQRIDVIDINNGWQRQQLLKKYVELQGKPKKINYTKTMTDNYLMIKFLNEISSSAHNWTKLILEPYLKSVPVKIKEIEQKLATKIEETKKFESSMLSATNTINQKTRQLIQIDDSARSIRNKLQKLQDGQLQGTIRLSNSVDRSQETPQNVQNYKLRINQCNQRVSQLESELKQLNKGKTEKQQAIKKCILQMEASRKDFLEKQKMIKEWRIGHIQEQIFKKQYRIGANVIFGSNSYSKEQRLQYLEKGELLPFGQVGGQFKCGQINKNLCNLHIISKDYALMPNKQFDPNQYISKNRSVFGKYNVSIQSKKTTLQGVKLFEEGKKLCLSYLEQFIVTKQEKELPLLRIVHKIPSEEHNFDLIRNADAQIRIEIKKISAFQQEIERLTSEMHEADNQAAQKKLQKQQTYKRKQQLQKQNKEAIENKIKEKEKKVQIQQKYQNQLDENQKTKKAIQQSTSKKKLDQQKFKLKIQECKKEIAILELSFKQEQFKHVRFAWLIRDQFSKKIPQTLANFIQIAKNMINQVAQKKSSKEADIKSKIQNLDSFLNVYESIKSKIEQQVNKHINEI